MKIPPTNMNGFDAYEDDPYVTEGINHPQLINGNQVVEEYNPPVQDSDFSEYMWMENEEEFDKEVMQRLEEEELTEQCYLQHYMDDQTQNSNETKENSNAKSEATEMAKSSTLNPHAAEFVPSWGRTPQSAETKSS